MSLAGHYTAWTRPNRASVAHTCELILRKIEREYQVGRDVLRKRTRVSHVVRARFAYEYELAAHTALSLPQIASKAGVGDHTTVIHGIRQHCKRNQLEAPR